MSTQDAVLHVVTAISNPCRYASRSRLYRDFARHIADSGAKLLSVEAAFGDRPHEVTESGRADHLQLRTSSELWLKERMLNLGIARLPAGWEYVAWVDADVTFARPDWAAETIHQLQHFDVVQMFEYATDLCPKYAPLKTHESFVAAYRRGQTVRRRSYEVYHPGFAWAARRSAIERLGGLFDVAILGSADRHMATALLTDVRLSHPRGLSGGYRQALSRWQDRARLLRRNVGVVPGTLLHHWHGSKKDRGYRSRWKILTEAGYDPRLDLVQDWQGLWALSSRSIALRDGLRRYFSIRNEDSIDVV